MTEELQTDSTRCKSVSLQFAKAGTYISAIQTDGSTARFAQWLSVGEHEMWPIIYLDDGEAQHANSSTRDLGYVRDG